MLGFCCRQWELFGGARSQPAKSPCSYVGRRPVWSPHPPCLALGNIICENQWGGADIRHGGDPVLRNNLISCGYSDGVVVGERGKGLIEGNVIYGKQANSSGERFSPSTPYSCPLGLARVPFTSRALQSCGGCPGGAVVSAAAQPVIDTGEYTRAPGGKRSSVLLEPLAPWPQRLPVLLEERPGHAGFQHCGAHRW